MSLFALQLWGQHRGHDAGPSPARLAVVPARGDAESGEQGRPWWSTTIYSPSARPGATARSRRPTASASPCSATGCWARYTPATSATATALTHLSDRFGVFATQAISCAPREAEYVLGRPENDTLVRPLAHTTDTHGFTEQLFGLCHLLGIAFMPRLKDLPAQHLYKLDKNTDYGPIEPLFRCVVDTALIAERGPAGAHRRLAARPVCRAGALQRLINASPADRVSKALTALGTGLQDALRPALHPRGIIRSSAAGRARARRRSDRIRLVEIGATW